MPILQPMLTILIDRENQTLQKTYNHNFSGFISKRKTKLVEILWNIGKAIVAKKGRMYDVIKSLLLTNKIYFGGNYNMECILQSSPQPQLHAINCLIKKYLKFYFNSIHIAT